MGKDIIPDRFREDFHAELSRLFWFRTNLFCYLTIFLFLASGTVVFFFFKGLFNAPGFPGSMVGGMVFPMVLLLTSGRKRSLSRQKARAFFFSFLLILVALLAAAAYPEIIKHLGVTMVLLSFFAGVLLLPWNVFETLLIGLFTIVNFMWIYRMAETYVSDELFALNIVLLLMAASIAAVVKRSEFALRKKEFVEHRDLEEKNARVARELELANKIHKSLLPRSVKHGLADVAVSYLPVLYMGGDYANFRFFGDDRLLFIVADMTGHGVSAALLVNRMDTEIQRLLNEKVTPGEMLKSLDDFITGNFGKMGYYLSAFAGLLDLSKNMLFYSNYGHPPQILVRSKGDEVVLLESQTSLMGMGIEAASVHSSSTVFERGDRLVLFTDGILDAKNASGEFYGHERLEVLAKSNKQINVAEFNDKLLQDVHVFQSGLQSDDIFVMTIQTK